MNNPFIKLIEEGRINKLTDLRSAYRKIVMRTHPDAIGSDKLVEKFLSYSNYYEEAKAFLSKKEVHKKHEEFNYRLLFYQQLYNIEYLEEPYSYKPKNFRKLINEAKQKAKEAALL